MRKRIGIVMAGGSGERFWPVSSERRPKQMLRLTQPDQTMLEEAVERIRPAVDAVRISTSLSLEEAIRSSRAVPQEDVLAEPARRNTLGALVWVVANLIARDESDAVVAIVTTDHAIGEPERFRQTVAAAFEAAERSGGLVTLGVPPERPETGYGYIERDHEAHLPLASGRRAHVARSFREKPDLETAQRYLATGRFLWNSGMFFFTVEGFRKALAATQPTAAEILEAIAACLARNDFEAARDAFARLESISFDYAVMERAEQVHVIETDFPWDDVGAWDALERTLSTDPEGNVLVGPAVALESKGCVIYNDAPNVAIGVYGLEDVVVVLTDSGLLVCRKEDAQRVREISRAALDRLREER